MLEDWIKLGVEVFLETFVIFSATVLAFVAFGFFVYASIEIGSLMWV